MIKAIRVEKGLVYYCGECSSKLDRMHIVSKFPTELFLDNVSHVILRCPICFTLSSVGREDCAN